MKDMKGVGMNEKQSRINLKEEGILEIRALTMTKGIFNQIEEVKQDKFTSVFGLEDTNPWNKMNWVGYVIDSANQQYWFLFDDGWKLRRIRHMELFFLLRDDEHKDPPTDLITGPTLLRQVFLK